MSLKTDNSHPANILRDASAAATHNSMVQMGYLVGATALQVFEKEQDVTFYALDNDGLERVWQSYLSDDDEALHDAVRDLFGLEG